MKNSSISLHKAFIDKSTKIIRTLNINVQSSFLVL